MKYHLVMCSVFFLTITSVITACSKDSNEDQSGPGLQSQQPEQPQQPQQPQQPESSANFVLNDNVIQKVNANVGKWNIKRKKVGNTSSSRYGKNPLFGQNIYIATSTTTSTTATSSTASTTATEEEIIGLMLPLVEEIENLISTERSIYTDIQSSYEYINGDIFNRADGIQGISRSLDEAEKIHNQAIEVKDALITISKNYIDSVDVVPESVYETSNTMMERVYQSINGVQEESTRSLDNLKSLIERAIDAFEVGNEEELRRAINEYNSTYNATYEFNNQLDDLLRNQIYQNGFDSPWINEYIGLSDAEKIEIFPQKLEEINSKVSLFLSYYQEAQEIDQRFESYVSGLEFNSSKSISRMYYWKDIVYESNYRYSVQNAWKRELFIRYITAKVGLLMYEEGELGQQYNAVFSLTNGREHLYQDWCQLPIILQNVIDGFSPIIQEYNELLPQYNFVGESYEGWEPYDKQFSIYFDFDQRIQSVQEELAIRISECDE